MKKNIKRLILKNHSTVENNIEEIVKFGIEIISSNFNKKQKTILIESLLLKACAIWEKFLETEIIYLVYLDPSKFCERLELSQKNIY